MAHARQAMRRDDNEPAVVLAFIQFGTTVPGYSPEEGCPYGVGIQRNSQGGGVPDLVIGVRWLAEDGTDREAMAWVEVKNREGADPKPKLTKDQQVWWKVWRGPSPFVVEGPDDVPAVMAVLMGRLDRKAARLKVVRGGR